MQHKWHKEIKAWADGAEIQARYFDRSAYGDNWEDEEFPSWGDALLEYRIKQQPKEPQYLYLFQGLGGALLCRKERHAFEHLGNYIGKIKLEDE